MNRTQYLIRLDDICATMNWKVWLELEAFLIQRQIKPILAVVPDNRDPGLEVDPPARDFWDRVRAWQERGWTIALHGYQHRYVTPNAGLVALRKKSEFAGLLPQEQRRKLQCGLEIFQREGIAARVWIAPGNTFDAATVALLPEFGIQVICDGCFRFPFISRSHSAPAGAAMTWVPQQLFQFRPAPPGVWTVCYHHNEWGAAQMKQFCDDVKDYAMNIASLNEVLDQGTLPERPWSEWLCTHPRFSRALIRAELKAWSWWCAASGRFWPAGAGRVEVSH